MRESTRLQVRYRYLDRFNLGGSLKSCEDFIVKEVIDPKFLRRFERKTKGVKKIEGRYLLILVKKQNMTTAEAVERIAKALNINKSDIGYAGLKDKFSVSYQYMTAPKDKIKSFKIKNIELSVVGRTNRKMFPGELLANDFEITLHECDMKALSSVSNLKVLPNYFSYQRFSHSNHIIGRCLAKRYFKTALKLINKSGYDYKNIKCVPREMLKFYVHAYQSWIFNETLRLYITENKRIRPSNIALFGFNTKLSSSIFDEIMKEIVGKEGITAKDFHFPELQFSCPGSRRLAFIKISDLDYSISGKSVKLRFRLPRGSYATNVLNAIGVKTKKAC